MKRSLLMAATLLATGLVAEAQLGKNLLGKVVQSASEKQVSPSAVPAPVLLSLAAMPIT